VLAGRWVGAAAAGMPQRVPAAGSRWQRLRAEFADLGPLRPAALATAALPTAGLMAVFARTPQVAAAWTAGGALAGRP